MENNPRGTPASQLKIRSITTLLLVGLALYVSAFPIYFAVRVGHSASELGNRTAHITYLYGTLARRSQDLSRAVLMAHQPAPSDSGAPASPGARLRSRVSAQGSRISPSNFAEVPSSMRIALARVDDQVTRLQTMLLEYAALLDLRRVEDARARHGSIDSLNSELQNNLSFAQRLGLEDLVQRSDAFRATGEFGIRAVLWWLAIGITAVWIAMWILWRRVNHPLKQLETGLDRVANGDLGVRLTVAVDDELGRLVTHFNQMTGLLHKRAQDQGRFVAAGELIAGIAHEVSNPLMAISALVSNRLADEEEVSGEVREELNLVLRQAHRAGKLLSGLLRFVRPDGGHVIAADLNQTIRESLDLISYRFHVDEIDLDEGAPIALPPVQGNPGKIEQVLVNILSNAADALKDVPPPRRIRVRCAFDDEMVRITIGDNGPGLRPDVESRLFHPFTSTKGEKGTGLGLYISREIAREAGGDLQLGTTDLRGATFVLTLPIVENGSYKSPPSGRSVPPTSSGGRPVSRIHGLAILVVDDEIAVRSPIVRFLRRRGARVEESSDGVAALTLLGTQEFDVVLADVRMPRMDGVGLYKAIEKTHPTMAARTLFLSGDISQIHDLSRGKIPADRMILKPVELFALEDAIADLLNRGLG